MKRRDFLKTLAAGVYAVTLPAVPGVSEASPWEYRLHGIEVTESAFGSVMRGMATLVDRPDITKMWAVRFDPEKLTQPEFFEELDNILRFSFGQELSYSQRMAVANA